MLKPATVQAIESDAAGAGIDPATISLIIQAILAIIALFAKKPVPAPTPAP